ncbi:MAG: phage holin family protein [Coriobacteriia bacterium]|nr:phage holin family protein [Coriobacteriia bacterium]
MKFLVRWLVTSIAVAAAAILVPGIEVSGNAVAAVIFSALIIGLVNATLGLVLKIGAIGCIVFTLGLFNLVINAWLLWFSGWIAQGFGFGFHVMGFWPAFWGSIVISIVSGTLNWFVTEHDRPSRKERHSVKRGRRRDRQERRRHAKRERRRA